MSCQILLSPGEGQPGQNFSEVLTALLQEPGIPVLYRHRCDAEYCHHGMKQTDLWTTSSGLSTGRDPFEVPPRAFTVTRFSSDERYFANQSAGLSVKCVLGGLEEFEIDRGLYRLEPGQALVMNAGRDYGSLIPSKPTRTLCVSFGKRMVAEVYRGWTETASSLLCEDRADSGRVPELLERIYPSDSDLFPALLQIERVAQDLDRAEELEEAALLLLERVLKLDDQHWAEMQRVQLQRPALRREIFQRLQRARDSMCSTWNGPGQLESWAQIAEMSRFHFLRLFKFVYGETPRQFFIGNRLQRARQKLRQSSDSILTIALDCGFESHSHFSNAFRQHFGVSPQGWRSAPGRI